MSRRHNKPAAGDPLLTFLAAHNCELYSPLSQTDTTDWISGNQIEVYAQNSMVWDSTNNIWKFQHVNGQPYNNDQYAAKWQLKTARPAQRTILTCCAELLAYNVGDINSCYDVLPTRAGLGLYGTKNVITDSAQLFAPNGSGVTQIQYRNGTNVFTYLYGSANIPAATYIRIATFHNSSQSAVTGPYGLRNFAFFSDPLTLDEINEYFSLI